MVLEVMGSPQLSYSSPAARAAASTAVCWSRRSTYPRPESTARPSIPNSTRINSAIRTIACPSCRFRRIDLVRVLSTVDRICGDDDVAADNLLDDRSDRLEGVPERHLDRLVADGGLDRVA